MWRGDEMKNRRVICILLSLLVMLLIGPSCIYAEEDEDSVSAFDNEYGCNHSWSDNGNGCYCWNCGATKPHNWAELYRTAGTCSLQEEIALECTDCGAWDMQYGNYGPHNWSEVTWWDMDWNDYYVYGKYCYDCEEFQKIPMTVKKGKTKRIVPKSFFKGAKKKHVSYNKKKVKAKKNGTVKGKKRGAVATVIWDVKFKNHRGYKWWETYEADIIIK